ncbi:uncharacterized protein LOC123270751 [Cotesia glomerata]|uniref:Uncharacterized protein n=1 Tax=Cotesia glomerata TaxID=32391 RepID=A0AAV7IFW1_COTGL|nr:uncharacterized protein LOC123270751 [Cotesia glomerata]KAH0551973.1 hypothetical protein KQX54_003601 [Cotesia glomerata]
MEVDESVGIELPIEVWESILREIDDPFALIKCQEICESFYWIVNNQIPKYEWRRRAKNYIQDFYFHEVMHKSSQDFYICDVLKVEDRQKWFGAFRSWFKWKMFDHKKIAAVKLIPAFETDTITCFDVWHDIIVAGTKSGMIEFFSVTEDFTTSKFDTKRIFSQPHGNKVVQVRLWSASDSLVFAISLSADNLVKFWNLETEKEITPGTIYADQICSSTMHNCFASLRGKITEYYYDQKSNKVICGVKIELDCENDTLLTLLSLHTKPVIVATNRFGILKTHNVSEPFLTRERQHFQVTQTYGGKPLTPQMKKINKFLVTFRNAVIGISDDELLIHASGVDWRIFTDFGNRNLKSVKTHGNNLFLGFSSGRVRVINYKNITFLFKYNYRVIEDNEITVSSSSAVDDIVVSEFEANPYVFTRASNKSLYIASLPIDDASVAHRST